MKNLPYCMLTKEDQEIEKWRREKSKAARKLRAAERAVEATKCRAYADVLVAAKSVVDNWESHDLAESVRDLDRALQNYHEVIK